MAESFLEKISNEAKAFVTAPIFPFMQKDWPIKMWLFILLSYIPPLGILVGRGWRKDYIHRIGWGKDKVLPHPKDTLQFLIDGVKLWAITGLYLSIPIILIATLGLGGWIDFWNDIKSIWNLTLDYMRHEMTGKEYLSKLWAFTKNEFWATFWVFLIENIYLLIYFPIYRVAMIRYALTGKLVQSHLAIKKNLKFLFKNLVDIILMYAFNIFNFFLVFLVDFIFSLTGIGLLIFPIFTFFMPFWNTGYEYGLLGKLMVEQENMIEERIHFVI